MWLQLGFIKEGKSLIERPLAAILKPATPLHSWADFVLVRCNIDVVVVVAVAVAIAVVDPIPGPSPSVWVLAGILGAFSHKNYAHINA